MSEDNSSSTGVSALQGPHQGAQKSMISVLSFEEVTFSKLSLFKLMSSLIIVIDYVVAFRIIFSWK